MNLYNSTARYAQNAKHAKKEHCDRVTVHTPWQPTGFCRVSTADKVAPKGVFSMDCALKPEKGCWLSGGGSE